MLTETPIDAYLADRSGTAVERFSRHHDAGLPLPTRAYRDLVPLTQPLPGQQYGFEVDLDLCTGCKACVTACHSLNGLDEDESWRSVGLLVGGPVEAPVQQTVTTACHHCVDPACLNGCPVDAYEKDPVTGIVAHLDDQCIGCGYCVLTCPYEVPRLNTARGIVRKCDLCRDRLADGEAPACVQACPNQAIRITLVDTAALVAEAKVEGTALVPGAPSSALTVPTTVYRTQRPPTEALRAADHFSLRPAPGHLPLALMLVLTQLAVGAVLAGLALRVLAGATWGEVPGRATAVATAVLGVVALGVSVLHLGRPRYCFRAVLGFRHSWLSREIVAFGTFAGLAVADAAARWAAGGGGSPAVVTALDVATALAGVGGVACSVMVYAVTRRTWWRAPVTTARFGLTTVVCGLAAVLVGATWSAAAGGAGAGLVRLLALLLVAASVAKLAGEASVFRHLRAQSPAQRAARAPEPTDGQRTARLLQRDLAAPVAWRFVLGGIGGTLLPLVVVGMAAASTPPLVLAAVVAGVGLVAVVGGELLERSLFFRAVTAPRMPGIAP